MMSGQHTHPDLEARIQRLEERSDAGDRVIDAMELRLGKIDKRLAALEPVPPPPAPEPPPPPTLTLAIDGLTSGQVVEGNLYVKAIPSGAVESIRFVIPGQVDRTERGAPYALASDHAGVLNPWDTTAVPNGEYVLTVTATLDDGSQIAHSLKFTINNPIAPPPDDAAKAIPQDLRELPATAFKPWTKWKGDHRFENIKAQPVSGTWGDWCWGNGGRLYIDGGKLVGPKGHRGQPFKGWSEYWFRGVEFRNLQWSTEANAGTKRGGLIDCDFYDVGEDAIRDVAGHIENVTIHSAKMLPGAHGDTIDWKSPVDGAVIKNLHSEAGVLHGIITADVKNLVIDGYTHRGHTLHPSINFGGDVENIVIRNCKLSGGIVFRGKKTNVQIDWDTVQINVKDWDNP